MDYSLNLEKKYNEYGDISFESPSSQLNILEDLTVGFNFMLSSFNMGDNNKLLTLIGQDDSKFVCSLLSDVSDTVTNLQIEIFDNGVSSEIILFDVSDTRFSNWNYVVLGFDYDSSKILLYLNGSFIAEQDYSLSTGEEFLSRLLIGATVDESDNIDSEFSGFIHNFFFINSLLSSLNIYKIFADNVYKIDEELEIYNQEENIIFLFNSDIVSVSGDIIYDVNKDFEGSLFTDSTSNAFWSTRTPILSNEAYSRFSFYYTSSSPFEMNVSSSNSIGGYLSKTPVYSNVQINQDVYLYDSTVFLEESVNSDNYPFIQINNELMEINNIGETSNLSISQRAFNDVREIHLSGDKCRLLSKNIFSNSFNLERKQYRCFAIKNDSYIKFSSLNLYMKKFNTQNNILKLWIEEPKIQSYSGIGTNWGGNNKSFYDDNLIGAYEDGDLVDNFIEICEGSNNGEIGIISTYNSTTGYIEFVDSFNSSQSNSFYYKIYPSPIQRVLSELQSPIIPNDEVFSITDNLVYLNVPFDDGKEFSFNDVIYLWVELEIPEKNAISENNSFLMNVKGNR